MSSHGYTRLDIDIKRNVDIGKVVIYKQLGNLVPLFPV